MDVLRRSGWSALKPVLSIQVVGLDVRRDLRLPLVSVIEELLFVVEQLFVRFGRELKVGALYDGVYRTRLLAESTVNTFGHVNVVASGSPAAVGSSLRFNGDGLSWTNGFAKFAGDASLLTRRIPPQSVFPSEPRRQRAFFKRVVDGRWFPEQVAHGHPQTSEELCPQQRRCRSVCDGLHVCGQLLSVHILKSLLLGGHTEWSN